MTVSSAKTSEPIKMPFEMCTQMGPRNHVLDGVQIPTCEETILRAKSGRLRTCPTVDKLSDSAGGKTGMVQLSVGVY